MRCPRCHAPDTRVLDSRPTEEGMAIRRRRECQVCGERFTTYEKVEATPLRVIKKDGRREVFNRDKILRGMLTACEKRPVELETLQAIAAEIERELQSRYDKEVESRVIGEMVMERLRRVDQVAYVRFASVYRQFKDIETFRRELDRLLAGDEAAAAGGGAPGRDRSGEPAPAVGSGPTGESRSEDAAEPSRREPDRRAGAASPNGSPRPGTAGFAGAITGDKPPAEQTPAKEGRRWN